jgi:hypothetical protein
MVPRTVPRHSWGLGNPWISWVFLHCILLVSHQEEFADAFSDGYHFELSDGSTKVTRKPR